MPNKPQQPPAEWHGVLYSVNETTGVEESSVDGGKTWHPVSGAPVHRPTSPPPPLKREPLDHLWHALEHIDNLRKTIDEMQARNNELFQKTMLLNGQLAAAQEALSKYECPNCGDSEQIVECHHDGETCGVPECDYKHCNGCGHQWGQN